MKRPTTNKGRAERLVDEYRAWTSGVSFDSSHAREFLVALIEVQLRVAEDRGRARARRSR